jgi:hypothetical protein
VVLVALQRLWLLHRHARRDGRRARLPRLLGPLFPQIAADVFPLYSFPLLLLLSLAGCLIGTYLTPAEDMGC